MKDYVLALIGIGGAIFGFVEFLINRRDKKKTDDSDVLKAINNLAVELDNLKEEEKIVKQNQLRCEILVMMNHYKNQTFEIMRLAEEYFVKLKGDFTLTSIFAQFLEDNNIKKPNWFNEDK